MAEPSTGPSQIVRRQLRHSDASGGFLHNVPNGLYRHLISPCPAYFAYPAEQSSSINCGCNEPILQFGSHPIGNWNRSNVASFADQINNCPMLFALLEMIQCQSHSFMPPQPTREKQCEQGPVTFSFQSLTIGCLPKRIALLCRQPVPEPDAQFLDSFDATNTG